MGEGLLPGTEMCHLHIADVAMETQGHWSGRATRSFQDRSPGSGASPSSFKGGGPLRTSDNQGITYQLDVSVSYLICLSLSFFICKVGWHQGHFMVLLEGQATWCTQRTEK